MVRMYFNALAVCWLFMATRAEAQHHRVNIAPPVEILRRQPQYNTRRPIQTEHVREIVQRAEEFLRYQVQFIPVSAECAAMQLTVDPVEMPYFKRYSAFPYYTKCDGYVADWFVKQTGIDAVAFQTFWPYVRQWWWANEMPAIAATYHSSPIELVVWFEDTVRAIWRDAIAHRNARELGAVAEPYLQDMHAGKVMPSWLADGALNARSHIVK